MAAHYDAAQKAQAAGDLAQSQVEYEKFISEGLRRLAGRNAAGGDLKRAVALLEEAVELTPNDTGLRLDLAKACSASGDLTRAKAAAEDLLRLDSKNSKAQLEMGDILSKMGDDAAATLHFEAAVAIEPNFENGYALAKEYLKQKNPDQAANIFAEMQAGLGDSPALHMEFGSAYGELGYPERGIPEFEKALAKNDKIRGGHYSLGAAYILGLGDVMQDKAEAEFRKELENYPDDPLSLYQLGSIEFNRHQFDAAERDLTKAGKLDDRNPDTQLLLAQIYNETGRPAEAEAALRKSIALTTNVARNHYQVQRAHYLLGRILMQSGRQTEAKEEMKTAEALQKESTAATQGVVTPTAGVESGETSPPSLPQDPEAMKEAVAFEQKIKDPIADSYNNLGVMAASTGNLLSALRSFQQAANWNPSLDGLDYNWGRAAFSAQDFQQAIGPLSRYLDKNPEDPGARAALGSSYFSVQNYAQAAQTLLPMAGLLDGRPQLSYIYAVSQVKTGDVAAGVARLEALAKTNPDVVQIPEALADAYAAMGEMEKAAREREIAKTIQERQAGTNPPSNPN